MHSISSGLKIPTAIAVDWINRAFYWVDQRVKTISKADLNGSNQEVVISNLSKPFALIVLPCERYVGYIELQVIVGYWQILVGPMSADDILSVVKQSPGQTSFGFPGAFEYKYPSEAAIICGAMQPVGMNPAVLQMPSFVSLSR